LGVLPKALAAWPLPCGSDHPLRGAPLAHAAPSSKTTRSRLPISTC